jgi:hypothetical protein
MRAPRRKRSPRRKVAGPRPDLDLQELSERVRYVGSPEHKETVSFAGQPRPRADATPCDRNVTQEQATQWLRTAIRRGAISSFMEGDFPRYAWHKVDDLVYEARLTNQQLGEYKGFPLKVSEWPENLDSIHE